MKGVEFVVDENGKKKSVLIDLEKYHGLWEDFFDTVRSLERADEPRISLEEVKKNIREISE